MPTTRQPWMIRVAYALAIGHYVGLNVRDEHGVFVLRGVFSDGGFGAALAKYSRVDDADAAVRLIMNQQPAGCTV